jgi:hypothetical protein
MFAAAADSIAFMYSSAFRETMVSLSRALHGLKTETDPSAKSSTFLVTTVRLYGIAVAG